MAQSSVVHVYRVEIDGKYGWFSSVYGADQFDEVMKRQKISAQNHLKSLTNQPTEIQQALLNLDDADYSRVHRQIIGELSRTDHAGRARLILDDLQHFAPDQVYGQAVFGLYFIAVADKRPSLGELRNLMGRYPQFKLGWPKDADTYKQQMNDDSGKEYQQLRARALRYWFDQANGDLSWLYSSAPNVAQQNYDQAFQWLQENAADRANWYYDQPTKTTGMIWYFTDINNMANILSYHEITSKNHGLTNGAIKNANTYGTKSWVNDFARFYLRPKTPTQYRNEGIYQYYGDQPDFTVMPKSLVNHARDGFWTTGKLAHLPVPVFIGFSLKKLLQRGGHLTKGSLAGRRVADRPEEMYDNDLSFLRENVAKIYSDKVTADKFLKHTEFIFPDKLVFEAADILRIVVRSEAEKLVLLTMLTEHDSALFSNKQAHEAIDPQKYVDRIVVDPDFFYFNERTYSTRRTTVQTGSGADTRNQYHLHLQPAVAPENLTRTEKAFGYEKTVNSNKSQVSVPALKQITLKVRDVNGEEKVVARFHDPDWILGVSKWIPSKDKRKNSAARGRVLKNRYYSTLYYHGQYYKLWREEGADEWHLAGSHRVANILAPADQAILKQVEDSLREGFENGGGASAATTPVTQDTTAVPPFGSSHGNAGFPPSQAPTEPQPTAPSVPQDSDDDDGGDDDDFLLLL